MRKPKNGRWSEVKNQFRDAWLIVLALGVILISGGNWLNMGPWLIAVLVSICMAIYGVVVQVDASYADVPADTKGDSIYYLGLIFTFGALVAALVTFDWDTSGIGVGTSGAIRNFGIALLTTIVGLVGRVWFTIFRESPGDLADSMRSDVERAVSAMKTSLDRARSDLEIMASQFRNSTTEMTRVTATASSYSKAVGDSTGVIARVARAFSDRVVEMTEVLESGISGVSKSFAAVSDSVGALVRDAAGLERHLGAVGSSVDKTARRVDELGKSAGDVARSVATTGSVAVRMTREMSSMERNIADAGKRAEWLNTMAGDARGKVGELHHGLSEATGRARKASGVIGKASVAAADLGKAVLGVSGTVDQTSEDVKTMRSGIVSAGDRASTVFSDSNGAVATLTKHMESATDGAELAKQAIEAAVNVAERLSQAVSAVEVVAANAVAKIEGLEEAMVSAVKRTDAPLGEVEKRSSEAIGRFTEGRDREGSARGPLVGNAVRWVLGRMADVGPSDRDESTQGRGAMQ